MNKTELINIIEEEIYQVAKQANILGKIGPVMRHVIANGIINAITEDHTIVETEELINIIWGAQEYDRKVSGKEFNKLVNAYMEGGYDNRREGQEGGTDA